MVVLVSITLSLLALHGLCLFIWSRQLVRLLASSRPIGTESFQPRAAVLLPVRGADPHLAECLNGLLNQDYRTYDICIVVDSREDSAWDVIARMPQPRPGVQVRVDVLKDPRPTCSLKLSALLQAIAGLDDACEIVALIDADVIPHAGWLSDLAGPLADPQTGATTGIRWYAPAGTSPPWGSLVRYWWNAAAVVHMAALHIAWGGSLALRLDVLRRSGLLEKWSLSLFDDTGCHDALRQIGLKVRFVPAALMVNRESIGLTGCFRFLCRQLLDVRLYHSGWRTVLGVGLVSTLALAAAVIVAIVAGIRGESFLAAVLGGGLLGYYLAMAALWLWIETSLKPLRDPQTSVGGPGILRTLLAIPLTQGVYFVSLATACWMRRMEWRGITYEFDGPWSVRMIEYRPWSPGQSQEKSESIS